MFLSVLLMSQGSVSSFSRNPPRIAEDLAIDRRFEFCIGSHIWVEYLNSAGAHLNSRLVRIWTLLETPIHISPYHLPNPLRNTWVTFILSYSTSFHHLHLFTQTLTTLNLSHNQIGAVGAQHLADALRHNTVSLFLSCSTSFHHLHLFTQTLTTLNLSGNLIGDDYARRLEELIARNNNAQSKTKH